MGVWNWVHQDIRLGGRCCNLFAMTLFDNETLINMSFENVNKAANTCTLSGITAILTPLSLCATLIFGAKSLLIVFWKSSHLRIK